MPVISRYSCNVCDFKFPSGWGGYTYAVNDLGQREACGHPSEFDDIRRITGLDYTEAQDAGRVGFAQHCICLECLKQFDLDLLRDVRACPECSSLQVHKLDDQIGQTCPRCKTGIIEERSIVQWKLDPDWEQLSVPQVVKDLTEFQVQRQVPASLQQAAEVASSFGTHNFFTITATLLDWWEGDYFSKDREQKDFVDMQPQWTWCKALPAVLEVTPALAKLLTIRRGRCYFAKEVSPDTRRGIKNYLRKHRPHVVVS